jgi:Asp-tRNA(Asn)/Glu-tRNA(Gln) amidotransferase C subunit
MISEQQKEKIRTEARALLDKFSKSLEKIPELKKKTEKTESFREESQGNPSNESFKSRILKNAPEKNQDAIISEKAKW